jgi:glycerol-3-phosphate dehydrogenase
MHPEILRELNAQRGRDLRERAYRAQLARTASQGRRAIRRNARHLNEADTFVVPAIPDYVDGTFRPAQDRVPAARHAA